jgi:alkanesulfonate monooxygenase SsuD/methylene tetrahydromethanopterin reductase-like flavin-dependent oxidoreductase (luciferase family)
MEVDLALSPFGTSAASLVEAARCAEDCGFAGVCTFDHLTGSMLGRRWSQDPFVVLGAMAAATSQLRLGPLVANMMIRHPVQLTLAMATLQSVSGGRAILGLGAGASPASRFAAEHEAVGTRLLPTGTERRARLAETIAVVDALWRGDQSFHGRFFTIDGLGEVVGPEPRPPLILGANGPAMVDLALELANGVNLNLGCDAPALLDRVVTARPVNFETSLLAAPGTDGNLDPGSYRHLPRLDRLIVLLTEPTDLKTISRLGDSLTR